MIISFNFFFFFISSKINCFGWLFLSLKSHTGVRAIKMVNNMDLQMNDSLVFGLSYMLLLLVFVDDLTQIKRRKKSETIIILPLYSIRFMCIDTASL